MALLSDGNPNDTEALRVYESSILNVTHVEGIDLDAKLGLATEEISQEVLNFLLDWAQLDPQGNERRRAGVSDIVVTAQVKRWHALHTLAVVYRDAYNNQINDRYRKKWEEYRDLAVGAKEQATLFGIGLVSTPVPRAAVPALGEVSGSNEAATYYVQVSWVSATGQEGSPSLATTYQTADATRLTVATVEPPVVAAGWNVYLGFGPTGLRQQNTALLAPSQVFTLPAGPLAAGKIASDGQSPDTYVAGSSTLRRG